MNASDRGHHVRRRPVPEVCSSIHTQLKFIDPHSAQIVGWNGENLAFGRREVSDAVWVQRLRRRDSVERFTE